MRYRRFENWSLRAEQHRPAHYEIVRRLMVVDGWCRLRLELVPADRGWRRRRRLVLDGRGHVGRHVAARLLFAMLPDSVSPDRARPTRRGVPRPLAYALRV